MSSVRSSFQPSRPIEWLDDRWYWDSGAPCTPGNFRTASIKLSIVQTENCSETKEQLSGPTYTDEIFFVFQKLEPTENVSELACKPLKRSRLDLGRVLLDKKGRELYSLYPRVNIEPGSVMKTLVQYDIYPCVVSSLPEHPNFHCVPGSDILEDKNLTSEIVIMSSKEEEKFKKGANLLGWSRLNDPDCYFSYTVNSNMPFGIYVANFNSVVDFLKTVRGVVDPKNASSLGNSESDEETNKEINVAVAFLKFKKELGKLVRHAFGLTLEWRVKRLYTERSLSVVWNTEKNDRPKNILNDSKAVFDFGMVACLLDDSPVNTRLPNRLSNELFELQRDGGNSCMFYRQRLQGWVGTMVIKPYRKHSGQKAGAANSITSRDGSATKINSRGTNCSIM